MKINKNVREIRLDLRARSTLNFRENNHTYLFPAVAR